MDKILLLCSLVLFSLACAVSRSETKVPIIHRQDAAEKPSPTPLPVNEADYVVTSLEQDKMKETTLDGQPREIIENILKNESSEKDEWRLPKKIKAKVEDRDINNDKIPERIIIARLYSEKGIPVIYIFGREKEKWNSLFELYLGSPGYDADIELEFLSKSDKGKFAIIKATEILGGKQIMKDVTYYTMQGDEYKRFECRRIEGVIEKLVPCN